MDSDAVVRAVEAPVDFHLWTSVKTAAASAVEAAEVGKGILEPVVRSLLAVHHIEAGRMLVGQPDFAYEPAGSAYLDLHIAVVEACHTKVVVVVELRDSHNRLQLVAESQDIDHLQLVGLLRLHSRRYQTHTLVQHMLSSSFVLLQARQAALAAAVARMLHLERIVHLLGPAHHL